MKIKDFFKNQKLRPGDFLIFTAVAAAGIFLTIKPQHKNGDKLLVQTEQDSYQFSLDKDNFYTFDGPLGKTTIEVKNHKVHIVDSPCPNKTCIQQGYGDLLICLPNKIIVTVQKEDGFDAIAE